jgi:hypothetical protein
MTRPAGGIWRRIAALALAGMLAVAGLWLAVGAGAKGGGSVRDAGYPVTYHFHTKIDSVRFGKLAITNSHKVRFKFHVKADPGYESQLQYIHTVCKRDHHHYKKCDSPKTYRHVHKGRHKFKVKAVYNNCSSCQDASKPDSFRWRVK